MPARPWGTYLALAALNRLADPCSKREVRRVVGQDGLRRDLPGSPRLCWITGGSGTPCTPSGMEQLAEV